VAAGQPPDVDRPLSEVAGVENIVATTKAILYGEDRFALVSEPFGEEFGAHATRARRGRPTLRLLHVYIMRVAASVRPKQAWKCLSSSKACNF